MSASLASPRKMARRMRRVWRVLQNGLANVGESRESRKMARRCRRVWRVSGVREYVSTRQSAHDKACRFMDPLAILFWKG